MSLWQLSLWRQYIKLSFVNGRLVTLSQLTLRPWLEALKLLGLRPSRVGLSKHLPRDARVGTMLNDSDIGELLLDAVIPKLVMVCCVQGVLRCMQGVLNSEGCVRYAGWGLPLGALVAVMKPESFLRQDAVCMLSCWRTSAVRGTVPPIWPWLWIYATCNISLLRGMMIGRCII